MAKSRTLIPLRVEIGRIITERLQASVGEPFHVNDILQTLKQNTTPQLELARGQLLDNALKQQIAAVCKTSHGLFGDDRQADFFENLPLAITMPGGLKKETAQITFSEAEALIHTNRPRPENVNMVKLRKKVEQLTPYRTSGSQTLHDAYIAMKKDGNP